MRESPDSRERTAADSGSRNSLSTTSVAIEGSRPETRREPSGGFFPGLEELVDDPAGGAPDDVVADGVVVDPILLLADAAGLAGVHPRVEQPIHGDDQQTAYLVRCQP